MSERHPNADVIIAFAEGRQIQWRADHEVWANFDETCDKRLGPWFDMHSEWRIKPEKVKQWVNIYDKGDGPYPGDFYLRKENANREASKNRIACIEIEYEEGEGL